MEVTPYMDGIVQYFKQHNINTNTKNASNDLQCSFFFGVGAQRRAASKQPAAQQAHSTIYMMYYVFGAQRFHVSQKYIHRMSTHQASGSESIPFDIWYCSNIRTGSNFFNHQKYYSNDSGNSIFAYS